MGTAGRSHDTTAMHEAVQRIGDSFDVIVGIKGQLEDYAEQARKWQGGSATKFQGTIQQFIERFGHVCDDLNDLREKLGGARMNLEASRQQQEEAVSKIDALLNGAT